MVTAERRGGYTPAIYAHTLRTSNYGITMQGDVARHLTTKMEKEERTVKTYQTPKVEFVEFDASDVIATSNPVDNEPGVNAAPTTDYDLF